MTTPTIPQMYVLTILNRELEAQTPETVQQAIFKRFGQRISLIRIQQMLWHLKGRGLVRFPNGDSLDSSAVKAYTMTKLGMDYYNFGVTTYRTLASQL